MYEDISGEQQLGEHTSEGASRDWGARGARGQQASPFPAQFCGRDASSLKKTIESLGRLLAVSRSATRGLRHDTDWQGISLWL